MKIKFWGVRGSVAVSGSHVAWIGGNTACLEVVSEGQRLILDAGTGIRGLGEAMMKEPRPQKASLLFSHLHWDHVQGFPFFSPAFVPGNELVLYGPGDQGDQELYRALDKQMQAPSFPVTLQAMRSTMRFASAQPGQKLDIGPFAVTPFELPHPQGCNGYRIDSGGKSFVYATDVEISLESLTPAVARYLEGADVLCLDAQYTPDEYVGRGGISKKGWGHSTMVDAARIARAVGAQRLYLFHHDPAHTDDQVEEMAIAARDTFDDAEPAREGISYNLAAAGA
jgi:phosphoribosyl 1,2-cyclic phosphodiesterase